MGLKQYVDHTPRRMETGSPGLNPCVPVSAETSPPGSCLVGHTSTVTFLHATARFSSTSWPPVSTPRKENRGRMRKGNGQRTQAKLGGDGFSKPYLESHTSRHLLASVWPKWGDVTAPTFDGVIREKLWGHIYISKSGAFCPIFYHENFPSSRKARRTDVP